MCSQHISPSTQWWTEKQYQVKGRIKHLLWTYIIIVFLVWKVICWHHYIGNLSTCEDFAVLTSFWTNVWSAVALNEWIITSFFTIIITSSNQRLGSAFYSICSVTMEKWVVWRKAIENHRYAFLTGWADLNWHTWKQGPKPLKKPKGSATLQSSQKKPWFLLPAKRNYYYYYSPEDPTAHWRHQGPCNTSSMHWI